MAHLLLEGDVLHDLVERDVSRTLDHHLDVVAPGDLGELPQRRQLGELGLVVGVGDRPGTQAVTQGEGHVVGGHDLADLLEPGVEEVLLVVGQAPGGHDRTAPADDAGHALRGHRHVAQQHPGVDGEVVHPLLGLLDQRVAVEVPGRAPPARRRPSPGPGRSGPSRSGPASCAGSTPGWCGCRVRWTGP